MKSIKTKFLTLILISVVLCTTIIGGIGVFVAMSFSNQITTYYLPSICNEQTNRMNLKLEKIKQSVELYTSISADEIQNNPSMSSEAMSRIRNYSSSFLRKTEGAKTIYFRLNDDIKTSNKGVFLEKTGNNTLEHELTDISKYSEDDIEHVGWYYIPIKEGKPTWLSPYNNKNIDLQIISYAIPIERNEKFLGIAGMDIDFDYIKEDIRKKPVFLTGFIYLKDKNDRILYHPTIPFGEQAVTSPSNFELSSELINGMRIVISAPYKEIRALRNMILVLTTIFSIIIAVIYVFIAKKLAGSIIFPLNQLNEAAKKVSFGNLDVELDIKSNDEIGELAKSLKKTTDSLKHYVDYINGLAYKDALTGVKNKAAYDNAIKQLENDIRSHNLEEYGIAVFDANGLKKINDTYGHDFGNLLIVNSCNLICEVFAHSPVFRIGGDEFVAILKNNDYKNRESLIKIFKEKMQVLQKCEKPYEKVSIACGIAIGTNSDSVAAVFSKADKLMYENKKAMKEIQENQ